MENNNFNNENANYYTNGTPNNGNPNNTNTYNNGYGPQNGYQQPQPPYNAGGTQNNSNGVAVAALVLGILSIVTACFIFIDLGLWVSLVLSILATILGACSKNKTGPYAGTRPAAGLAGMVLGIIMLVINVVLVLIAIVALATFIKMI